MRANDPLRVTSLPNDPLRITSVVDGTRRRHEFFVHTSTLKVLESEDAVVINITFGTVPLLSNPTSTSDVAVVLGDKIVAIEFKEYAKVRQYAEDVVRRCTVTGIKAESCYILVCLSPLPWPWLFNKLSPMWRDSYLSFTSTSIAFIYRVVCNMPKTV